ncbi:hypothetical protein PGT21_000133 [Puccinia graminis f. sp. tritici]|uniref:Uncharacterized protein n=1 Tax=Puccinia graminis f. sp. tritici TaxID=56615 RepID=A0A5B0NVF3_PUCGR|nr:hypothetical protein PGT21_000133 [Puccinia graminis f. sp. tritici]
MDLEMRRSQLEVNYQPRAENNSARGQYLIVTVPLGPNASIARGTDLELKTIQLEFQLEVVTLLYPWLHQSPNAKGLIHLRPRTEIVSARGRCGPLWASFCSLP